MERDRGGRPQYPGILTPAEQRVLQELRQGGTNAEIAIRLGLSPETVKTHIASMLSKLELADRHALAAWRDDGAPRRRWLFAPLLKPLVGAAAAAGIVGGVLVAVVLLGGGTESVRDGVPPIVGNDAVCERDSVVADAENNPGLVADCEVLLAAKDALEGAATLNWGPDRSLSTWEGVSLAGFPSRVVGVHLRGTGLTGSIPPVLAGLKGLQTLDLSRNDLTGSIPPELATMATLVSLQLNHNDLTGTIPPELGQLSNLAWLNLRDNRLTGPIPEEMGYLTQLRELLLSNNQLTGTLPAPLSRLQLEIFYVTGNAITGCVPAGLRDRVADTDIGILGADDCPPEPCALPTDSTCIRAVYVGEPDDYDAVSDIPDEVALRPEGDGVYEVQRGQQVTVVTAASIPERFSHYVLLREPEERPSATGNERLPVASRHTGTSIGIALMHGLAIAGAV